jgi:hypothetical protein
VKVSTSYVDIALLLLFFGGCLRDQLLQKLFLIVHLNSCLSLGLRSLWNCTCSTRTVLNIEHFHLNNVEEETEDSNYEHDTPYDWLGSNHS